MRQQESAKSVEEKLAIVLEGLKESINISDLCRRHGISQTNYYRWRDKFFEGGKGALASNGAAKTSSEADIARIAELERVIGPAPYFAPRCARTGFLSSGGHLLSRFGNS